MDFLSILSAPRVLAWGIQVPQIIEWAVEVIGAVFLLFAVCFAWACCTTHFDFWRVRKVLAQHPSHLTKQNLEDVSDHFEKKIRKLAPLWREFHKTIVPERMGSASANVFATRPAEEFFPVPTLVDHRIGASIYLAVPGVMTSLGLLGTFLALFSGLTGLRVEASGQVTGIQGFITGLSGKFVSSIVGLISAILSLVIVRYFLAGMHDTATALQTTLNKAFQRKPQEMILNEMLRQLEDQSSAYKSFSADLAGEIKSSFNTDIARLGDKLTETLERLNVNISRQGDSFRSFADAFADTLRGSLKDGMQPGIETLQKSLTELAVATEELKKHSAESSQDTMEKMLAQFQKSLTGAAGGQFAELAEKLGQSAQFSEQMNQQMRELLFEMKRSVELQREGMAKERDALEVSMTKMLENFSALSNTQLRDVQQQLTSVIEQSKEWTQQFQSTFLEKTEQQNARYADFVASLKNAQVEYLATSNRSVDTMIGSVQQMNRQINDSLDGQRLEMTKERDALKAYVDQLLENLGNLSKAQMSEVQQQLSSALAQTHHWTQQFESTFSEKARNQQLQYLDFLDGMKNTQAEYLANSSQSLDSMISSVGKINQQIGNSLDFHRDEITKEREVLKVSVNEMLQSVGRISQAQIQGVQQQLDSALERTHQWTEHFETSLAQRSQHQQVQYSQFLDEIKKAQFEYLATSNQSMGALINSVQQHTVQVEASMERVIQRVSSQGQSMQELTASVSTAIREFEGLVVKNSVLSAQLQKAADALKLTSLQAEEASRSLGLANRDSALASERLGAALNNSKITFEHMQTVLKDHEALYKTLDEKLEKSVQQISSAIAAYNKVTTDGLNRHLSDFDSSLAAACARLAETVETIESPIDELAEVITKVTTKLSR